MPKSFKNLALVLGFSFVVLSFSMLLIEFVSPAYDFHVSLIMAGTMAAIFGFIFFCTMTTPEKLPRNDGWRKWRPLVWFVGLYAALGAVPMYYGHNYFDWSTGFVAAFMAGMGWVFLDLRRQRFEQLTRWSEEEAKPIGQKLAERAADIRGLREQLAEDASNHYAPMIDDRLAAKDYAGAMEIANELGKIDMLAYSFAMDRIRMARGDYEPKGKATT